MTLSLRAAKPGDETLLMQFIQELAAYEHLEHDVVATPDDLANALFCDAPKVFAVLAVWDGKPAGFALYYFSYSTFAGKHKVYLEDLYVRDAFRGAGIGKQLLIELARLAREQDCSQVEWSVLDWNAPSIAFYDGLGAKHAKEWLPYALSGDAMVQLADEGDPQ
ncbi:MAG: GNAT family N-acetyltransferase [Pseudomonadota bacterium]